MEKTVQPLPSQYAGERRRALQTDPVTIACTDHDQALARRRGRSASVSHDSVGTRPPVATSMRWASSSAGFRVPAQSREMVAGVVLTLAAKSDCVSLASSR